MSKTSVILILLLALCAGALAQSDSLISAELIKAETVNYNTVEVQQGEYVRTYNASGTEYYPHSYQLRFETAGAKFVEYTVKRGDVIKAGDTLAVFTLNTDSVTLSSKQLSLARAQEAFDEQKRAMQETMGALREQLANAPDRFEREILSLRVARQELTLEQYIYQQNRAILTLQEEIAELEEKNAQNKLLSPVDGVITSLTYKRVGDLISTSEVLITLYRTNNMLLRVDNSSQYFRYGMRVNVEVGPAKTRTVLTGRVVGADTLIPENRRTHHAFIALDPYDTEEIRLLNPSVKVATFKLDNVLVMPRRALVLDGGKYYVTKLTDGMVQKRYVNYIMNNNTDAWVLQGVSEGETLIID